MERNPLSCFFLLLLFISKVSFAQLQTDCTGSYSSAHLDYNYVDALLQQGGMLWWDLINDASYEVPKGDGVSALFAGAIWMGGIDENGQLRIAAQSYRQNGNDFFPGPLDANGNTNYDQCHDFDRHWKVLRSSVDSLRDTLYGNNIPQNLLEWPGRNNPHLSYSIPNLHLAPFIDVNNDGNYDAKKGDYPSIHGDQSIWWVFNDYGNIHTETGGIPLQAEVQAQAYSYKKGNCLDDITFYEYTVINKSPVTIDSFFFAQWIDYDLGCYTDDFMGTDSSRNMLIIYNADNFDDTDCALNYGAWVPMLGVRFLKGPPDKYGNPFHVNTIMYYIGDFTETGNPQVTKDYYYYMDGRWRDGTHLTSGGNGYGGTQPANFVFPSDPSDPNGWSECAENNVPADRRVVMSAGPYILAPHQQTTFSIAVVFDRSFLQYNPCPTFEGIREKSDCAKIWFDALVGLDDVQTENPLVSVYPNPTSGYLHFDFPAPGSWQIDLIDVAGKVRFSFVTQVTNAIDQQMDTDPGVYLLRISSDKYSFVQKLIVMAEE